MLISGEKIWTKGFPLLFIHAVCVCVVALSFVLFGYRLCIEWPLLHSDRPQQEAVPCRITLAWI